MNTSTTLTATTAATVTALNTQGESAMDKWTIVSIDTETGITQQQMEEEIATATEASTQDIWTTVSIETETGITEEQMEEEIAAATDVTNHTTANKGGTMLLTTKSQIISARNEFLGKSQVSMLKIIVDPKGVNYEVTSTPGSYSAEEAIIRTSPLSLVKVKNFTKEVVSIQFLDAGEDTSAKENSSVYNHCAILYTNQGAEILPFIKTPQGGGFRSLREGRSYTFQEISIMGATLYVAGPISASEGRKATATLYRVESSSKELVAYIDNKTYGSFGLLYGRQMQRTALQKLATRFGQFKTGMGLTKSSDAPTALYVGKWQLEDGFNYADGAGFVNMNELAKQLSASTKKYDVTANACKGLMIQHRPYSMWKLESNVVSPYFIRVKMAFDANGEDNFIWVKRDSSNQEIYNNAFDSKELQGKVIILYSNDEDFGNPQNVSVYTDLNGAKERHDITRNSGLNVMKIDKPEHGESVALNTQFLESMIYADKDRTMEIVKGLSDAEVNLQKERLLTAEVGLPSMRDVDSLYVPAIIKGIAPKYALQNKRLFAEMAEDMFKGLSKKTQGLSFEVMGKNRLLTSDPASHFGLRLLDSSECFIPGIANGIKVAPMRNPKMTPGEFLVLRNVSLAVYLERVENSSLSDSIKYAVSDFARNLTLSCIALPSYSDVLDMLGGADYDGDTAAVLSDSRVVSLLETIKSMAIRVDNSAAAINSSDVTFDEKAFGKAFYDLINNGNKSIGEVTYMANLLLSLVGQIRKGKRADALHLFKTILGNVDGEEGYTPLLREAANASNGEAVTVSFDIMFNIIESAKNMALTDENMMAVLMDLVTCHMMLQMETIDAPKKGTKVPVAFPELLQAMKQVSKTKLFVSPGLIDSRSESEKKFSTVSKDGIIFSVEAREGVVTEGKRKSYFVQDDLHDIRKASARQVFEAAREIRGFSFDKNNAIHDNFFRLAGEEFKGNMMESFLQLKYAFNTLSSTKGIPSDDQEQIIQAIANTGRALSSNISTADRGRLAEYVSMPKAGTENVHSPFALKVFREEYLEMAMEYFAESKIYGEEILVHRNIQDGDVMEFAAGLAIDGEKEASVREPITGTYTVTKLHGRFYATREIERAETSFDPSLPVFVRAEYSADLVAALASGTELELSVTGKGDRILVNGKAIGKLITNSGFKGLSGLYHGLVGTPSVFFTTAEDTRRGKKSMVGFTLISNNIQEEVGSVEDSASFSFEYSEEDIANLEMTEVAGDVF